MSTDEEKVASFLANGGKINVAPPKRRLVRYERAVCEKCYDNTASQKFCDDEGNQYHWCLKCFNQ